MRIAILHAHQVYSNLTIIRDFLNYFIAIIIYYYNHEKTDIPPQAHFYPHA